MTNLINVSSPRNLFLLSLLEYFQEKEEGSEI